MKKVAEILRAPTEQVIVNIVGVIAIFERIAGHEKVDRTPLLQKRFEIQQLLQRVQRVLERVIGDDDVCYPIAQRFVRGCRREEVFVPERPD